MPDMPQPPHSESSQPKAPKTRQNNKPRQKPQARPKPPKLSKSQQMIEDFFAPLLDERGGKMSGTRESDNVLEALCAQRVLKKGQYYFDWTASGLAHRGILRRLERILPYYANTHSHFSSHAALMSELYAEAKRRILGYLGLDSEFVLLAGGSGASFGIKKFQEIMGIYAPPRALARLGVNPKRVQSLAQNLFIQSLPHVILSGYEHHSNEISYREGLCVVHKVGFDEKGSFDIGALERLLGELDSDKRDCKRLDSEIQAPKSQAPEIIASLSAASNVTGLLTPIERISPLLRQAGGIIALDMAALSPYGNVPSHLFDAAFFAPHKLLGGVGSCGLLAVRSGLIDGDLAPSFAGGGVIEYANGIEHCYIADKQQREEAGTPPILGLLNAALAYGLRNEVGLEWIRRREKILLEYFLHELGQIPVVTIYGDLEAERLGIVSFNIGAISPIELCAVLSKRFGIHTRAGCSCAGSYGHYLIGGDREHKPMWLRVSIHYTHRLEEIDYLIASIKESVRILRQMH